MNFTIRYSDERIFDNQKTKARRRYRLFVNKGIDEGKRSDLTGGELIQSIG